MLKKRQLARRPLMCPRLFEKWSFDRKFIRPNAFFSKKGHLTEKVFDKRYNNLDSSLDSEKIFLFLNL
jgi:hypothetical protein